MDIKCKKNSCVYNKAGSCQAGVIVIGSDLDCKSYKKNINLKANEANLKIGLFEVGAEYSSYKVSKNSKIECKASKCLFNKNNCCTANGISVLSGRGNAFCATNIEK